MFDTRARGGKVGRVLLKVAAADAWADEDAAVASARRRVFSWPLVSLLLLLLLLLLSLLLLLLLLLPLPLFLALALVSVSVAVGRICVCVDGYPH